jgi:DNA polymerase-3 subunit delta
MVQKKAHEVEGWLARPDPDYWAVLLYGPDRGLVSERAMAFVKASGLDLHDPFSVIRLDGGLLDQDPGRLLEEARTVGMFGGGRLIWIRYPTGARPLADSFSELAADPPPDTRLLIEAGELKKAAPLRTAFEQAATAMALPCYPDEERTIDSLIDAALSEWSLTIEPSARQHLRMRLGGDRLASRAELEKLVLYAKDAGRVTLEHVRAATGDVSADSADDAADALLDGDPDRLDYALRRFMAAGGGAPGLLSSVMRLFQQLEALAESMTAEGRHAAAAVAAARPPVFFSRRRRFEQALERHGPAFWSRALAALERSILQTRKNPELARAIASRALLSICVQMRGDRRKPLIVSRQN